jgi:hypothetical protein
MYTYMDEAIYSSIHTRRELNVFRDYLSFLGKMGEQTDDEKALMGTTAHEFLKAMEKTNMTKMYKMPILLAFYNSGSMKLEIDEDDIYKSFEEFYSRGSNAVDMLKDKITMNFREWGKKEYVKLAHDNPIHFLKESSKEFFCEEGERFCINPELGKYIANPAFAEHFKDIIDYRARRFYKERLEKKWGSLLKGSDRH